MVDAATIAQYAVNGLALGSIIALSAVGLTLVYGILNLSNFSHGDLLTAGAYAALFFLAVRTVPQSASIAFWIAGILVAAALVDRYWWRRLSNAERGGLVGAAGVLAGLAAGLSDNAPMAPLWIRIAVPAALLATLLGLHRLGRFERLPLLLGGGTAILVAAAWLWATPILLAVGLAMVVVAGIAAGFEMAVWRPLREGRLRVGSHVLLGGFVGWMVGLVLANRVFDDPDLRLPLLLGGIVVGSLASWRFLGDRPIARANLVTYIMASIGVAFIIRYGLVMRFGGGLQSLPLPAPPASRYFGLFFLYFQQITFAVVLAVLLLLHLGLTYTKFGKAVRAVADNLELARITGIDVDRTVLHVWLLAGALTAVAGVLLALNVGTFGPELGWTYLLLMFSAVILGGIGSVYGSLVGGFAIGLATELSVLLFDSAYKFAVAFLVLIALLLIRPQGLFGVKAG